VNRGAWRRSERGFVVKKDKELHPGKSGRKEGWGKINKREEFISQMDWKTDVF